jgi:hypothetical protein
VVVDWKSHPAPFQGGFPKISYKFVIKFKIIQGNQNINQQGGHKKKINIQNFNIHDL